MTNQENMKKWLSVINTPSTKEKGMITEDVEGALKTIHSDVLSRPESTATPDKVTARVAGGMRGVSHDEVKSGFDSLSKKNGFADFADELNSAKGAHDEEMHVAEELVDEEDMEEGNEFSGALAAAKMQHKKSFKVDGKNYQVKEDSGHEAGAYPHEFQNWQQDAQAYGLKVEKAPQDATGNMTQNFQAVDKQNQIVGFWDGKAGNGVLAKTPQEYQQKIGKQGMSAYGREQYQKDVKAAGIGMRGPFGESSEENACPVCEAMPCECDNKEMVSEEWSVIYDSAYAKNVPARVRLNAGMNEDEVREWFSKAFQPLSIHEVLIRKPIDPKDKSLSPIIEPKQDTDPFGVLKPKPKPGKKPNKNAPEVYMGEEQIDEILPALAAGAGALATGAARVGGAVVRGAVQGAKALGNIAVKGAQAAGNVVAKGAQAAGNVVAKGAQAAGNAAGNALVKGANVAGQAAGSFGQGMASQQQPAPGQQQQPQPALQQSQMQQKLGQMPGAGGQQKFKPGPIQVDTKKKVVITPAGVIPFTQIITKEDREQRGEDESEVKSALSDIHEKLGGDYDLDKQYDAIHEVSEESGISYRKLLGAWVTDPSGMKEAISAAKDAADDTEEMPAEELPAEEPAPAALPAPGDETAQLEQPVQESRKKKAKVIKEGHQVMLDVRDDHEVQMAQSQLYQMVKNASDLHNMLDSMGELEGWVQAKITLAADYINRVKDYVEYEMVRGSTEHHGHRSPNDFYEDDPLHEAKDDDKEDKEDDADSDKIPHIVMQLRKAKDVDGNHKVRFEDGTSHYVSMTVIKNFLEKHDKQKPSVKDTMARDAIKSLKHLKARAE